MNESCRNNISSVFRAHLSTSCIIYKGIHERCSIVSMELFIIVMHNVHYILLRREIKIIGT